MLSRSTQLPIESDKDFLESSSVLFSLDTFTEKERRVDNIDIDQNMLRGPHLQEKDVWSHHTGDQGIKYYIYEKELERTTRTSIRLSKMSFLFPLSSSENIPQTTCHNYLFALQTIAPDIIISCQVLFSSPPRRRYYHL